MKLKNKQVKDSYKISLIILSSLYFMERYKIDIIEASDMVEDCLYNDLAVDEFIKVMDTYGNYPLSKLDTSLFLIEAIKTNFPSVNLHL